MFTRCTWEIKEKKFVVKNFDQEDIQKAQIILYYTHISLSWKCIKKYRNTCETIQKDIEDPAYLVNNRGRHLLLNNRFSAAYT